MWAVMDGIDVHVMPVDDLIAHENHADCICGPDVEIHDRWLYVHHSLDGREQHES